METVDNSMSIGEVAKLFGVSVPTIRNWELMGRLTSFRSSRNERRFIKSKVAEKYAAWRAFNSKEPE
jgi:excisionase family DNA binding protein